MDQLSARVAATIARVMEDPSLADVITADTSLLHDVGIDSLKMISFLLAVEDEFDIEIDFESLEPEHLASLSAFCQFAFGARVDA